MGVPLNCRHEPVRLVVDFDVRYIERDLVGITTTVEFEIHLLNPIYGRLTWHGLHLNYHKYDSILERANSPR